MGYTERDDLPVGPVSLVTHSGSVFSTLLRTRLRLGFDLAVSSGQELVTTTADYVDHLVERGETRVLALVLETIRGGDRLRWSLRRAREAGIEVVLLPGRPLAPRLGDGGRALRARSPAARPPGRRSPTTSPATSSATWPSSADTLAVLASTRRPRPGTGIATVHDSGAERSLVADLAHGLDVPLRRRSAPHTLAALADRLDEGLVAENPLDVWGGGADTHRALRRLPGRDGRRPGGRRDRSGRRPGAGARRRHLLPRRASSRSPPPPTAPVVALTGLPAAVDEDAADRLRAAGVPVLEGFRSGLLALRHLLDSVDRPAPDAGRRGAQSPSRGPVQWQTSLVAYGIPTPPRSAAHPSEAAVSGGRGGRLAGRPQDGRTGHRASLRRRRRGARACTTPPPSRRRTRTWPLGSDPRSPSHHQVAGRRRALGRPGAGRRASARWSWSRRAACSSSCCRTAPSRCRRCPRDAARRMRGPAQDPAVARRLPRRRRRPTSRPWSTWSSPCPDLAARTRRRARRARPEPCHRQPRGRRRGRRARSCPA